MYAVPFQEILRGFTPLNDKTALEMTVGYCFALGDLSTTLEMTFFGDRHFDQAKRVEKSPKAKQGYAMKSVFDG